MSFEEFAGICERINSTTSKNEKVRILASYLKGLDDQSLRIACTFLSSRIFPKGSRLDLNLGYSNVFDVIRDITDLNNDRLRQEYIRYGDLGEVASIAISNLKVKPLFSIKLYLEHVYQEFVKIAKARGEGSIDLKKRILKGLLINCSALEAKYLVKIILNELRIGLVEGLLEQAIAYAFNSNKVRRAMLMLSDAGEVALLAKHSRLDDVKIRLFKPISFMLADTIASIDEVKGKEMVVEYKYDGIRVQLHKSDDKARIFSRRLDDISDSFPEVIDEALRIKYDLIIDGEIIAIKDNKVSFKELQKRLRSKVVRIDIPIKFMVYDILYLDGEMLIDKSLMERKDMLSSISFNKPFEVSDYKLTKDTNDIISMFNTSKEYGHEGLMLKDPKASYQLGKRGKYWLKLKHAKDTIDAIIVAAEYGHGKRARLLSDYTFAVKSDDGLKVIGKAYSGLTDDEIKDMTSRLKSIMVKDEGYRIWVKPEIVVEVAYDSIAKSNRYDSNFALRFPRIKAIRFDKGIDDIDSIDRIEELYHKHGKND